MRREQLNELGREAHRARIRRIVILAVLLGGSALLFGSHAWRVHRTVRDLEAAYDRANATPLGTDEHARHMKEYLRLREELVQLGHWQASTIELPAFPATNEAAAILRVRLREAVADARHVAFSIALTEEKPLLRATIFGPPHVIFAARQYLHDANVERATEAPDPVPPLPDDAF